MRKPRSRGWIALATVIIMGAVGPVAASADVESVATNPLSGPSKAPKEGGISAQSAGPADGYFFCTVPLAPVAAAPSGFIIGNCPQGNYFLRQKKSDNYPVGNGTTWWDGGFIYGEFNGCGWIGNNYSTYWVPGTGGPCDYNSIGYNDNEYQRANNEASVNGHRFLPSGGHRFSPLADTFSPHWRPSELPVSLCRAGSRGALRP